DLTVDAQRARIRPVAIERAAALLEHGRHGRELAAIGALDHEIALLGAGAGENGGNDVHRRERQRGADRAPRCHCWSHGFPGQSWPTPGNGGGGLTLEHQTLPTELCVGPSSVWQKAHEPSRLTRVDMVAARCSFVVGSA